MIGRPGTGKTTLLRDITCHLADTAGLGPSVVVVDTSNEVRRAACVGLAARDLVAVELRGCCAAAA